VKAKRLGATGGFFESRTTSDDVPNSRWQELCGAGWTETNMVICADSTSSVIGPWKGPSGESLLCMRCPSGTYSATGLMCNPCPMGYTSPSGSKLASQCDQQISVATTDYSVLITLTVPMQLAEFTKEVQLNFKKGLTLAVEGSCGCLDVQEASCACLKDGSCSCLDVSQVIITVIITGITVALRRLLGAALTVAFKLTGLASADEQQQVSG